ncbi:MAG TPA: lipid II flippase MurJ, partial [Rhizomicrobium sp.]|nr:lipid II flippase MurJ [Rhizomicrobium sp.]
MLKKLLSVGGFTLLSRITGFARDMLLAWIMGKGILSDAFFVAFLFPNNFRAIFGEGTLNPAFLPRYAALHARGEKIQAAAFADRVFAWQMAVQIAVLALAMIFMPELIRLVSPGFTRDPHQFALTVSLARVTFPYLMLTVVAVQLSAMLNAIDRFWAAAAWSNLLNLAMIAALLAWHWFPSAAYAAAWGVLAGGAAQLVFIVWAGAREGLWLRLSWPRFSPEIKEFFVAIGAVTIGQASVVLSPLI